MGQGWSLRETVESVLFQPPVASYGYDVKNLIWLDGMGQDGQPAMFPALYIRHPEARHAMRRQRVRGSGT